MATAVVDWDAPSAGPASDQASVWHVVPGFVSTTEAVTLFRPTADTFADSFRLFGIPAGHACRLETGLPAGAFLGPDWFLTVHNKSILGIPRYVIRDAGRPTSCLAADATTEAGGSNGTMAARLGTDTEPAAAIEWYLVPRAPNPAGGYDIVHAASGRRLVDAGLALGTDLPPLTAAAAAAVEAWDVMRSGRTYGAYRAHFWLPPFFATPFGESGRARPPPPQGWEALTGIRAQGSGVVRSARTAGDCIAACGADPACRAAGVDTVAAAGTGTCLLVRDPATMDPGADVPTPALEAVADVQRKLTAYYRDIERERRVFGDFRHRPREYSSTAYTTDTRAFLTYYQRAANAPPDLAAAYKQCVTRLGPDSATCDALLPTDRSKWYDIQSPALRAVCTGPNLRTKRCREFCTDQRSVADRVCEAPLRTLCASQTETASVESMCACWLATETYEKARQEAIAATNDNALAQRINEIITANNIDPKCWFSACRASSFKPPDTCPDQQILTCVLVSQNNRFTAGGNVNHSQVCQQAAGAGGQPPISVTIPTTGTDTDTGTGTGTGTGTPDDNTAPATTTAPPTPPSLPPPAPTTTTWWVVGGVVLLVVLLVAAVVLLARRKK